MEMHLVYRTPDGSKTAVVGVFIMHGKKHRELEKIWAELPEEEGDEIEVEKFHLHKILPEKTNTFSYVGSLTTPPCTEGVTWNILTTPIAMSLEQIEEFQNVFSGDHFPNGNARPIQPLNDRGITTNVKD